MQEELTTIQKLVNTVLEFSVNYSFQVLGAVIVLIAGSFVAGWIAKLLLGIFEKKGLDITLSRFLAGIVKVVILAFAVLIALGKFGITIAPFVAALGAMAFGISFAVQGPIANYGAGITIILTRPFVVGDTITVADENGVVEEVKLACTILTNEDGVKITIPNKHIVGEILRNSKANKVVEGVIGISYDSNAQKAIDIIQGILEAHNEVDKEVAYQVGIQEFADSSVNIGFRYWVPTVAFFKVSYAINLEIYKAFEEQGIQIPFPQRDVHIVSQGQGSERQIGASS